MSFGELNLQPPMVRRLEEMGYLDPTPIQAQAIPTLLEGRDVIGLAPTGTGKTAAYIVPVAHALREAKPAERYRSDGPRALVICPTRELAQQVADEAARLVAGSGLQVVSVFGGVGIEPQKHELASGVDVVVGTPGRLRELRDADALTLAFVRHVVIDEADRMLDMGFLPQVIDLVARVPDGRQTALFTATMPPDVEVLATRFTRGAVRIEIGTHTRTVEHVEQRLFPVHEKKKLDLLIALIERESLRGVLVFTRTRRRCGWVAAALARHGIQNMPIHGDRTQAQRRRAIEKLRRGALQAIVATDVAARGLHIESVRTVVNYDLPTDAEAYVHRVGRAGHGGAIAGHEAVGGEALTLLDPRDKAKWASIAAAVDVSIEPTFLDDFPYERPGASRGRDASTPSRDTKRPRKRRNRKRDSSKQHEPPRPGDRPKRRHAPGRPIRGDDRPGGGVPRNRKP